MAINNSGHKRSITKKREMKSSSSILLVFLSCFLFFLVNARKENAFERSEGEIEAITYHYQTLEVSSFLKSSICSRSNNGDKKRGSLEVFHKDGPCSKFSEDMIKPLTIQEIMSRDESRVDWIKSKTGEKYIQGSKTTLPAKSGRPIGTAEYIVTIGLGTPKTDLTLLFDTGSDLTWTQCQPCAGSCYSQKEPIFEPTSSSTYSNISCTSTECTGLSSTTGNPPDCSSSTCVYDVEYGDGSVTQGFLAKEKLTLTSDDVTDGFVFGCGQLNQGLFVGVAGLLGLGSDNLSIVSQAAEKYGKVFSYCLPSTVSSTGYLTFGSSGIGSNVAYTSLSTSPSIGSLYDLDLEAIYVGGRKLEITPIVFQTSGMIIDSGTVVTRLPPTAYSALRMAFREGMTQYPLTKPVSIFDTCYDLSKFRTIRIPTISVVWGGNIKVDIASQGILIPVGVTQACLAFAGNRDDSDTGIFGNIQQKTLQVVYNVAEGKVGFAPGGCA